MKCFKYQVGKKSDYRIEWIQARPAKTFEQKQIVYFMWRLNKNLRFLPYFVF